MDDNEKKILQCWQKNTAAWTRAVREQEIESRKLVTDRAIVEALVSLPGKTVLDVGCGEGWLAHALSDRGLSVTGVDAIPAFIEDAARSGRCRFLCLAYEELSPEALAANGAAPRYDLLVCNFSLLGLESVDGLIQRTPSLLNPGGHLVVQTLNPNAERGSETYRDGWRPGSWQGFSDDFVDPAPWYFRTTETWRALFDAAGFSQVQTREPVNPVTGQPASIIFIAR